MSRPAGDGDNRHEDQVIGPSDAIVITGLSGRVLMVTEAALTLLERHSIGQHGPTLTSWFSGDAASMISGLIARFEDDVTLSMQETRPPAADDSPSALSLEVRRLPDSPDDRAVLRWTFREDPPADARWATDDANWTRFLADADLAFWKERSAEGVLQQVAARATPSIADWTAVDLLDSGDFYLRRAAVVYSDPRVARSVQSMRRRYPITEDWTHPVVDVLRTGEPALISRMTDEHLRRMTRDEEHFAFVKGLGLRSSMILPLAVDGRVIGAITFSSSGSQRIYRGGDLRRVTDYAERAALAIETARRIERAEQSVMITEHYLSIASHELRTPLAVISGFASLLLTEIERGSPDAGKARRLGRELQAGVERLETMTEDLLAATAARRQDTQLETSEVDLAELVDQVIQRFTIISSAEESHRIARLGAPSVTGYWNADLLDRALSNLVSNAVKYSPDGSEVTVTLDGHGPEHVRIEVKDSGIGISADELERIFQPFTRGMAARRMNEGTGLGLYITRQIVEQHGGVIDVESTEGVGSAFSIILPVRRE